MIAVLKQACCDIQSNKFKCIQYHHPLAGVLSAYGMGLAEIRCMRESQFERALSDYEDALALLSELSGKATDQVVSQGVDNEDVIVECRRTCG